MKSPSDVDTAELTGVPVPLESKESSISVFVYRMSVYLLLMWESCKTAPMAEVGSYNLKF